MLELKKGKGYKPAEDQRDKYHGVSKFDIATGSKNPNRTLLLVQKYLQKH